MLEYIKNRAIELLDKYQDEIEEKDYKKLRKAIQLLFFLGYNGYFTNASEEKTIISKENK